MSRVQKSGSGFSLFNSDDNIKRSSMPNPEKAKSHTLPSFSVQKTSKKTKTFQLLILKEGYMVKKGHIVHNWKRRWFQLTPGTLSYFTSDKVKKKI